MIIIYRYTCEGCRSPYADRAAALIHALQDHGNATVTAAVAQRIPECEGDMNRECAQHDDLCRPEPSH